MARTEEYEDVHHAIHVAIFWRELLGDDGYNSYDHEDLHRWYDQLETRGPVEIRAVMQEYTGRWPRTHFQTLVGRAPHPPISLVQLWLETHEHKTDKTPYWAGLAIVLVLCATFAPKIMGLQHLPVSSNPFATHPPGTVTVQPGTFASLPVPPMQGAPALPPSQMAPDGEPATAATPPQ